MEERNGQEMGQALRMVGQNYPQSWDRVYVQCPFYKRSDGVKRISCEGPIPDTTVVSLFRRSGDYKIQMDKFCCSGYKTCELYRATYDSREW